MTGITSSSSIKWSFPDLWNSLGTEIIPSYFDRFSIWCTKKKQRKMHGSLNWYVFIDFILERDWDLHFIGFHNETVNWIWNIWTPFKLDDALSEEYYEKEIKAKYILAWILSNFFSNAIESLQYLASSKTVLNHWKNSTPFYYFPSSFCKKKTTWIFCWIFISHQQYFSHVLNFASEYFWYKKIMPFTSIVLNIPLK